MGGYPRALFWAVEEVGLVPRGSLAQVTLSSLLPSSCLYLRPWALHKKLPQPPAGALVLAHFSLAFPGFLLWLPSAEPIDFAFCYFPPAPVTCIQMLGPCKFSAWLHSVHLSHKLPSWYLHTFLEERSEAQKHCPIPSFCACLGF